MIERGKRRTYMIASWYLSARARGWGWRRYYRGRILFAQSWNEVCGEERGCNRLLLSCSVARMGTPFYGLIEFEKSKKSVLNHVPMPHKVLCRIQVRGIRGRP